MKNKKLLISILVPISIFIFILALDLLTKNFIIKLIPNEGDAIKVIPGFINFVYVKNTGAAWGVLAGRSIFLILISIIILGLYLAFYIIRNKKHKCETSLVFSISVGLIAGGCLGNLVDRIVFGYVRDFINFEFISFPVFNFADISLTFGIILMIIYFFFIYSKEEKKLNKELDKDCQNAIKNKKNDEKIDDEENITRENQENINQDKENNKDKIE